MHIYNDEAPKKLGYPLVSVVVTPYNSRATIGLVLDAVLRQTYPLDRIELVIVDGGSRDGTLDIIKEFLKNYSNRFYRATLIVHDRNYGVSKARNDGIRESRGEYILILDADIVIPPNAIEELVKAAMSNPKGCRVFGTVNLMTNPDVSMEFRQRVKSDAITYDYGISEATLIPRELVQKIGYYDETLGPPFTNYEDIEYGARAWRAGYKICTLGYLKAIHYHYEHDVGSFDKPKEQDSFMKAIMGRFSLYLSPKYGYLIYRFVHSLPTNHKVLWVSYSLEPIILLATFLSMAFSLKLAMLLVISLVIVALIHYVLLIREFWNPKHLMDLLIFSAAVMISRITRSTRMLIYLFLKGIRGSS